MSSRHMALCGVLTALAVMFLLLGGVIPAAMLCGPVLAMAALLPVLEEIGPKAAGTAYAAASILALLLSADPESGLVYLFFGWYPILRPKIAGLSSRLLRLGLRLAVCNATIFLLYGLLLHFLGLTDDVEAAPRLLRVLLLLMGNGLFLLLDRVLARLTSLWNQRLRQRFFR